MLGFAAMPTAADAELPAAEARDDDDDVGRVTENRAKMAETARHQLDQI